MGTKNNPGKFDCYFNAKPDEPMFILLGRDPFAPQLVELWATLRLLKGEDPAKVAEAQDCAASMRDWLQSLLKEESPKLDNVGADLLAALIKNHEWHLQYDDSGTYEGSALWESNRAAITKAQGRFIDESTDFEIRQKNEEPFAAQS